MCTGQKQRRHCFGIHPRQSSGPSCRYIEVNAQEKMHDVYCNTSSPRLLQSNTTNLVLHLMKGRILYAKLCINNRHQHVQAAKKRNNGAGRGIKHPTSEGSPALPPPLLRHTDNPQSNPRSTSLYSKNKSETNYLPSMVAGNVGCRSKHWKKRFKIWQYLVQIEGVKIGGNAPCRFSSRLCRRRSRRGRSCRRPPAKHPVWPCCSGEDPFLARSWRF